MTDNSIDAVGATWEELAQLDPLWAILTEPINSLGRPDEVKITYTSLTAPFDMQMQVAIYAGIVMASPIWLYEIFAFLTAP